MDTHKARHDPIDAPPQERRMHRRSRSEFLRLTFLGVEHVASDWSEGGALVLDRHPELAVGTTIAGIATIGPASHRFRFTAEIIRREPPNIALRFVDLSPALQRALTQSNL
jgi:hypothetical protein